MRGRARTPRGLAMAAACVLGALSACSPPDPLAVVREVGDLEDRRVADPQAWEGLLARATEAEARRRLARALGRTRDRRLEPLLRRWLDESAAEAVPALLAEQIFALGQMGDPASAPSLEPFLDSPHTALRARAVQALGKLGERPGAVTALLPMLDDPAPETRSAALLALTRLRGRRAAPAEALPDAQAARLREAAGRLLSDPEAEVRWRAVYLLSEVELTGRLPLLQQVAASAETLERFFAARGLGRLSGEERASALTTLSMLVEDARTQVAAAAAAALGELSVPEAATPLLAAATRRGRIADWHVRRASLEGLARLPREGPEDAARRAVAARSALEDPSRSVRAQALISLARLAPEEAVTPLAAAASGEADRRQAAATAAGHLPFSATGDLLRRLARDEEPMVAAAALTALAEQTGAGEAPRRAALAALKVDDVAVRGTALGILKEKGKAADVEAIAASYPAMDGAEWVETRVEALTAAAALGGAGAERLLRSATKDPFPAVRRAAVVGLARLGGGEPGPPPLEGPPSSVTLVAGRDVLSPAPRPRVRLETDRGSLVLELFREEAPRHVRSFLDLARAGFYDGLPFHRVVSGFVVQGLDPREDGWGTGGVFLRDEINPMPFLAGTVGMPNAGPDSGGCQIFITHVPTPHLDGAYTVFGRVVEGMDVLNRLDVGDRCQRVEVLPVP